MHSLTNKIKNAIIIQALEEITPSINLLCYKKKKSEEDLLG